MANIRFIVRFKDDTSPHVVHPVKVMGRDGKEAGNIRLTGLECSILERAFEDNPDVTWEAEKPGTLYSVGKPDHKGGWGMTHGPGALEDMFDSSADPGSFILKLSEDADPCPVYQGTGALWVEIK